MSTIAIVGSGPGLEIAVARRFAKEGFHIALISRNQSHVDALASELNKQGFTARGYAANVRCPEALKLALDEAAKELGPVEVLQYSPVPQQEFLRPLLETSVANLTAATEFSINGPVAAVNQVLSGMRALEQGTILFVNGASGARPNANVAGTSIAFAGESAYAQMLHDVLSKEGIYVGQFIIPKAISPGHPTHDPDVLAETLWLMHTTRDTFRWFAEDLDD
nr:SDR family NAD(P)-dependent oxidoreductase [uncultured Desulfuromonas sp.]